jgi:hypothetical protein
MIQAIETIYPWPNGHRFRSRREARWAVFFDTLGIPYEYEKQGYDLGKYGWYLPDFWLPHIGLWFEVKGELKTVYEPWPYGKGGVYAVYPELEQLRHFADLHGRPVACAVGSVGEHGLRFFAWDVTESSGGSYETDDAEWCLCDGIYTVDAKPGRSDRCFISDNLCGEYLPQFECRKYDPFSIENVQGAYARARQARFEHGEHGR